jgi:hypothetical protein
MESQEIVKNWDVCDALTQKLIAVAHFHIEKLASSRQCSEAAGEASVERIVFRHFWKFTFPSTSGRKFYNVQLVSLEVKAQMSPAGSQN